MRDNDFLPLGFVTFSCMLCAFAMGFAAGVDRGVCRENARANRPCPKIAAPQSPMNVEQTLPKQPAVKSGQESAGKEAGQVTVERTCELGSIELACKQ
jgi:hypothetical protein